MRFRTKDLLVTVLPQADPTECLLHSALAICVGGSRGPGQLPGGKSHGSPCCPMCLGGSMDQWFIQDREDLVALRAELQDAIKKLDELERAGLPSGIRSRADAEQVERGLNEALTQVRALKRKLG